MARIDFDLDDLTQAGLKRLVKQLLAASDDEEKKIIAKLGKHNASEEKAEGKPHKERNDLADLHEEKHGKPNTPMVSDDDLPYDGDDELPDVPTKKGKK
jgi:hypothetical protein